MTTQEMKIALAEYGKTFEDFFELFSIPSSAAAYGQDIHVLAAAAGWKKLN